MAVASLSGYRGKLQVSQTLKLLLSGEHLVVEVTRGWIQKDGMIHLPTSGNGFKRR